jgi:glycerol-3-phosphate dehydrogenase (NAD(P)+)
MLPSGDASRVSPDPAGPACGPIVVAGAGAWGTALAVLLAGNGTEVRLWSHRAAQVLELASERENLRYLPGVCLPESVRPELDLPAAMRGAGLLIIATPVAGVREVCRQLSGRLPAGFPVAWAAKGIDPDSGQLLHQVVAEWLPDQAGAVISGPTFATELARGEPSALVVAAYTGAVAEAVAVRIRRASLRTYTSTDVIGVEVGGAVKNVLAIAAGVADGLGLGANARAALITRGLAEIRRLGVALGAEPATFMGLAGLGDLVLTCTDNQSRNRRYGLALARGASPVEAARELGQVAEGARTAPLVVALAARLGVELPICTEVAGLIAAERTPAAALARLLAREPREES